MKKMILTGVMIMVVLMFTGCGYSSMSDEEVIAYAMELLETYMETNEEEGEAEEIDSVEIMFLFPAGSSPKVFQNGWIYGAKCIVTNEDGSTKDVSNQLGWSGSATFSSPVGNRTRTYFDSVGSNSMTITYQADEAVYSKTINVTTVSEHLYARVGGTSQANNDAHGCLACPHTTKGPIISGSPLIYINGKPAARVGDIGVHAVCCGPNTFEIVGGDSQVLIDGRPAAKIGSSVQHCGGLGEIIAVE